MLRSHSYVGAVICALCTVLAGCGDEKTDETTTPVEILDPADEHYGMSYSEWNAEWYKWIYEYPYGEECQLPIDDSTGENCGIGQSGDVFFLAGSIAADTTVVVRDGCKVPSGKALFFPVANSVADNGGVPEPLPDEDNQAAVEGTLGMIQTENLFASVDEEELTDLERFETDIAEFAYELPEEPNFYTCLGASGVTGTISPAYAGGYYVMVAPLSKGAHTIRFGLDQADDLWAIDITYNLTVE